MNCQAFSCGLSSGHLVSSGMMLMLSGTMIFGVMCHPAWSSDVTACRPGLTLAEMAASCRIYRLGVALIG